MTREQPDHARSSLRATSRTPERSSIRARILAAKILACVLVAPSIPHGDEGVPSPAARLAVGEASGSPGARVEIELHGESGCTVNGFALAIGHDASTVAFIESEPGELLVAHAAEDLVFEVFPFETGGYTTLFVAFDLSAPLTVPPIAIPPDTVLATLAYQIYPDATPGTEVALRNETRVFGEPNPVDNIFTVPAERTEIHPELSSGRIIVSGEGVPFLRGDANGDASVDLSDAVYILLGLFAGGEQPACEDAADANDDGRIDLSDAVAALGYLFQGAAAPPAPGPITSGTDPTPDDLTC